MPIKNQSAAVIGSQIDIIMKMFSVGLGQTANSNRSTEHLSMQINLTR